MQIICNLFTKLRRVQDKRQCNKFYLPSRERRQNTNTMMKSFPPTRMAPLGAGSVQ